MSFPEVFVARPDTECSSRARSQWVYICLIGFATLLGLALRLRAAHGDLWLDEIWTLLLLERAKTIGDVFIGVHHDNNHFLNSAWLWLVGPDAPTTLMRLPAIVFGALAILTAAALGRRFCDAAGVIAAVLIAVSYFFVHYSSEARGYSGMILAILVAYNALEGMLANEETIANRIVFAVAICFGTFSHLTMVEATGVLCLAAWARLTPGDVSLKASLQSAVPIFIIGGLATIPAVVCFVVGALSPDFHVGYQEPFTFGMLAQGLADMARSTLGFPRAFPDLVVVIATAILALASLALVPAHRRWFPALAVFALPILHAAFGLPNQFNARFHLTSAVGLIVLSGDSLAVLWRRKHGPQAIAALAIGLFAAAQSFELAQFFGSGRGAYKEAIKAMSERGPVTYSIDPAGLRLGTRSVLGYHAAGLGMEAKAISEEAWCESAPNWLILANMPNSTPVLPQRKTAGPANCQATFLRDRTFDAWGLSGVDWTLYHRAD
jgi:hypothetical protein